MAITASEIAKAKRHWHIRAKLLLARQHAAAAPDVVEAVFDEVTIEIPASLALGQIDAVLRVLDAWLTAHSFALEPGEDFWA